MPRGIYGSSKKYHWDDVNHICGICGKEFDKLCQDHHHESGQLRDMLCRSCNFIIGFAMEDEEILLSAIEYLKRWKEGRVNATEREKEGWKFVAKKLNLKVIEKLIESEGEI
jgi:hypothetical protein